MKIKILTTLKLSNKIKNRIKHEVYKNYGKNVYSLHKLPNMYHVYTDIVVQHPETNPTELFKEVLQTGTHYFFGAIQLKKTHQKIFFLVNIKEPMYITENNKIFYPEKEEIIMVYVK